MARPLRMDRAGLWYHITARGNERRDIFVDDQDRRHFLTLLEELTNLFDVRLHAFVLMSNHYHLLMELTEPNLSRAMHWLNVSYTVWFNRRHERSGHMLQGRFKSVVVEPEAWALELSRYLHLNPVRVRRHGLGKREVQRSRALGVEEVNRAQVQERLKQLRLYRWSSYRAYIGTEKRPAWLCTGEVLRFGGMVRNAAERYRQHVEEALREGTTERPLDRVVDQMVLGTERFATKLAKQKANGSVGSKYRPTFEQVVSAVEKIEGAKWKEFRDQYGDDRRDLVLYLAHRQGGLPYRQLCEQTQIAYPSVAAAVRRFGLRLAKEKGLQRRLEKAVTKMNNA